MTQQQPTRDAAYPTVDITDRIRERFAQYLPSDVVSVKIVQPRDIVWLEVTREKEVGGYRMNQSITRTDLRIIAAPGDGWYDYDSSSRFNPRNSVYINADIFADELDPLSIVMTTDLFREDTYKEISRLHIEDQLDM